MRLPSPWVTASLIVGSVIAYLQVGSYRAAHPLTEEAGAPAFAMPMLARPRDTVRLADFRGHVLIVEAWSRTCINCKSAMPALEALARDYHDGGLRVLHVALEDLVDTIPVRAFLAELGLSDEDVAVDQGGAFRENYAVVGI